MPIEITEDDLHAYADGVLPNPRLHAVEAFLAERPDARQKVEAYRSQNMELRQAFAHVISEPVPGGLNLRTMIARRRAGPAFRIPMSLAASVAGLMLASGGAGWALHAELAPTARGIEALAREAAASYATYAPDDTRPVEIDAAGRVELAAWISQRLRHPVHAPDLAHAGYRLLGGRLVATPNGPAGLFLYQGAAGARIAVLVRPMAIDRTARMARHAVDGLEGYAWADEGIGYSLVGAAPSSTLHPLADAVRRQVTSRPV